MQRAGGLERGQLPVPVHDRVPPIVRSPARSAHRQQRIVDARPRAPAAARRNAAARRPAPPSGGWLRPLAGIRGAGVGQHQGGKRASQQASPGRRGEPRRTAAGPAAGSNGRRAAAVRGCRPRRAGRRRGAASVRRPAARAPAVPAPSISTRARRLASSVGKVERRSWTAARLRRSGRSARQRRPIVADQAQSDRPVRLRPSARTTVACRPSTPPLGGRDQQRQPMRSRQQHGRLAQCPQPLQQRCGRLRCRAAPRGRR